MRCDICGKFDGHSTRCPKYVPPKAMFYCSACGEGIYPGEEYIENYCSEHKHYDCIYGMRDLIEWLGYEIKVMEDEC